MSLNASNPAVAPIQTPLLLDSSLTGKEGQDRGLLTTPWIMYLKSIEARIAGSGAQAAGLFTTIVNLTAPTTAIPAPTLAPGSVLVYILKQDAAGARTVTWEPTFAFGAASPQPGPAANTDSVFIFYLETASKARLIALPIKGMPL